MSQIDPQYFEKDIIETENGYLCLTRLGVGYGISLITALTILNSKLQGYEKFKDLEPYDLPKGIVEELDGIMRINQKGIGFIQHYIENHPLHESVYNLALNLKDTSNNEKII